MYKGTRKIAPTADLLNTYNQTSAARQGPLLFYFFILFCVFRLLLQFRRVSQNSFRPLGDDLAVEMSLDLGTGVTIDVAGVALSQKYIVAVLLGIAICEDPFFSYTFLPISAHCG